MGSDSDGDDVREEKRLEGVKVGGFEKEALEIRVEVPVQSFVGRSKDCYVVCRHGFL